MNNQKVMNIHYPIRVDEQLHRKMMSAKAEGNLVWSELIRDFIRSKIEEVQNKEVAHNN